MHQDCVESKHTCAQPCPKMAEQLDGPSGAEQTSLTLNHALMNSSQGMNTGMLFLDILNYVDFITMVALYCKWYSDHCHTSNNMCCVINNITSRHPFTNGLIF